MPAVYVGLGSNLDNPVAQLNRAQAALRDMDFIRFDRISPYYCTRPWGAIKDQPDFVNAVAKIDVQVSPHDLLRALQGVERQQLRVRNQHQRYGPRTIDLDILLFDQSVITTDILTVPHPRMAERDFVLYPLYDIAPDLVVPGGMSVRQLKDRLPVVCPPVRLKYPS